MFGVAWLGTQIFVGLSVLFLASWFYPGADVRTLMTQPGFLAMGALLHTLGQGILVGVLLQARRVAPSRRSARPLAVCTAAAAGLVVGTLPTWYVPLLRDWWGRPTVLEDLAGALQGGSPATAVLVFTICVLAPVVEELVFRGYLWSVAENQAQPWLLLGLTTCFFALSHGELLHGLGVVPIGLFLGLLRMRTLSVLPCIAAHTANNMLATGLMLGAGPDSGLHLPALVAFIGTPLAFATLWFPWMRET